MIHETINKLDQILHFQRAEAHCDIPCGIYDPHQAQIAALTVIRMIDLMTDLAGGRRRRLEFHNTIARYVAVKEEHAELCKRGGASFGAITLRRNTSRSIQSCPAWCTRSCSGARKAARQPSAQAAVELLSAVNRFAEIYWETKGVPTKRVKAPYKPSEEIVHPVL